MPCPVGGADQICATRHRRIRRERRQDYGGGRRWGQRGTVAAATTGGNEPKQDKRRPDTEQTNAPVHPCHNQTPFFYSIRVGVCDKSLPIGTLNASRVHPPSHRVLVPRIFVGVRRSIPL